MAGTTWRVLLFFGIPLVFAMPPNGMEGGVPLSGDMPHFRQDTPAEDFSGGFSKDFALNLPTNEFLGNFHGRIKRQVGVSSTIDGILNSPYGHELAPNHLQALLNRNSFIRPARQSAGSRPETQSAGSRPETQSAGSRPETQSSASSRVRPPFQSSTQTFSTQQRQPPQPRPSFSTQQSQPPQSRPSFSTQQSQSPQPRPSFSTQQRQPPQPQPSFSTQQRQPPQPRPSFSNRPTFSNQQAETRNQPSPHPRPQNFEVDQRPQFGTRNPSSRNDGFGQEPFSSSSFTGQQFRGSFSDFGNFFQPQRSQRQKRQVVQRQDISSQLSEILSSPYKGPIPSSITSLYSRNNRFPRKSQANFSPASSPTDEKPNSRHETITSSKNPFEIPFEIPNFFERLGIKKRSVDVAERRQGISTAIDDILTSPYQGSIPSSIQSLLDFNKNRFVRKTQPSPQPNPNPHPQPFSGPQPQPSPQPQPVAHARPFPQPVAQPHPISHAQPGFHQPHPVVSNNPSHASVRLVPNFNGPSSSFDADLSSGHIFFRGQGRKKRSAGPRKFEPPRSTRRFPPGNQLHHTRRVQRINLHPSNRLKPNHNGRPRPGNRPEFGHEENFDEVSGRGRSRPYNQREQVNSLDFSPIEGIKTLDFLSNFNTPLLGDADNEDLRVHAETLLAVQELRAESAHKPQWPPRNQPRFPFLGRIRQSRFSIPGLRPGPSPPAHILPASATVRAPRHVAMENRLLPMSTRQQDIPVIRRSMEVAESKQSEDLFPIDVKAAKENSVGFIVGVPNNFPLFSSVGGFEPMPAQDKGDESASFVPAFQPPVVEFPDIPDDQPKFQRPAFAQQKQGSVILHLNNVSGHETKTENQLTRRRRTAGEPDPAAEDPSTIPHKRVHRVQTEGQIPHNRNPREFQAIPDNEASFSDIPFQVEPFPQFQFPFFQSERIPASRNPTRSFESASHTRDINRKVQIRTPDDDFIVPESQRFYPNYNSRSPPASHIPSRQPFFPSAPILGPRPLGSRGGRFNGHGPGFRESPSVQNNNGGFRDFHETFYGPGAREAKNRPDFSFPSSRRPVHRENEPLDSTLLGSGNFEVLRGGTFYDEDDPEIHNGFDHLLHEGYYGSHSQHNSPHSNNHVDDFFSNFRDFSEFAARRSDEGETSLGDGTFYGHGYASEHVHHVIDSSHPDFQDAMANRRTQEEEDSSVQDDKQTREKTTVSKPTKKTIANSPNKINGKFKHHKKHRQPKNIQEVLEDLDDQPSDNALSSSTVDEKDPMLALF